MQNFESLALNFTELWLFKYFWQLLSACSSCQKTSLHFPEVCLTLCCFPIFIFKLCLCANSTAVKFPWVHPFYSCGNYQWRTSYHFPQLPCNCSNLYKSTPFLLSSPPMIVRYSFMYTVYCNLGFGNKMYRKTLEKKCTFI